MAEDTVSKPEGVPFPSPTAGPVSDWSLTVYESLKDWAGQRGGSWARWEPGCLVLTIDKHNGESIDPAVIDTSGDALTVTFGYWDHESREEDDTAALAEIRQWAENWIEGVWSTAVYTQEDGRWCGSRCVDGPGIPDWISDVRSMSHCSPTHVEIRRARKSEWRRYAIVDGALIDDPRSRHERDR